MQSTINSKAKVLLAVPAVLPDRVSPSLQNLAVVGFRGAVAGGDGGGDGVQQDGGFVMTRRVDGKLGALPSLTPHFQ